MTSTVRATAVIGHFFWVLVCVSTVATEPMNNTSRDDGMQGPGHNLSERMKTVLASFRDPLFGAGINVMLYCSPILIILGIIGNIMAFIVVTRKKNRQISCCTYMAALAVSDSGSLITLGYLWWTILTLKTWTVPACVGWVYVVFLNTAGSGFLLVGVTFDRFMAICLPFKARVWCTPKRARIMVGCIMAFVAIFYIPMAIMSNVVDGNVCVAFGYDSTLNIALANINLIALPILPFFILLIMNIMIIFAVRRSGDFKASVEQARGRGAAGKEEEEETTKKTKHNARDRQLTVMLVTISCAYVVIILPVSVRVLVYSFVDQYASPHQYAVFVFLYSVINQILFLNNAINFYLYFLTGSKFRKDLKQLMMQAIHICWKPKEENDLQMNSSSTNSTHFYRSIPTEGSGAHLSEGASLLDK